MTNQHIPHEQATDAASVPPSDPAPLELTLVGADDAGVCVDDTCFIPNQ